MCIRDRRVRYFTESISKGESASWGAQMLGRPDVRVANRAGVAGLSLSESAPACAHRRSQIDAEVAVGRIDPGRDAGGVGHRTNDVDPGNRGNGSAPVDLAAGTQDAVE